MICSNDEVFLSEFCALPFVFIPPTKEQAKTVAETTSVVQESNVDTRKLIEKVSDT
jgi:hypothetical protein